MSNSSVRRRNRPETELFEDAAELEDWLLSIARGIAAGEVYGVAVATVGPDGPAARWRVLGVQPGRRIDLLEALERLRDRVLHERRAPRVSWRRHRSS